VDAIDPAAFAGDERLPYWADLWSSAIALAVFLRDRPDLAGARVLELGCGTGLAGIAAAQAGGRVVVTDYEEDALRFARANAEINLGAAARHRLRAELLDWRTPGAAGTYDLILGADIVYDRANFPFLLDVFRASMAPGGAVLIADPERIIGRDFLRDAEASGFAVTGFSTSVSRRGRVSGVGISELRRARR
jgi:predicted nicotinamide N-methyase